MEQVIRRMMEENGVSGERLYREKEIPTADEPLRWDYFQYVLKHPITEWDSQTEILYGGKDNFQTRAVITDFSRRFGCGLTVSEESEHPFMAAKDFEVVAEWLKKHI